MSEYLVNLKQGVDFAPSSEIAEILQNVRTILTTRLGSVPLERDFGLSWEHIDQPINVARALMKAEIIEAVERFEPRAIVEAVSFDESVEDGQDGLTRPRVTISIKGEA